MRLTHVHRDSTQPHDISLRYNVIHNEVREQYRTQRSDMKHKGVLVECKSGKA